MHSFSFDGSLLTLSENSLEEKSTTANGASKCTVIVQLTNATEETLFVKKLFSKQTTLQNQILVDELKPLFGLHKIGTHRVRIGSKKEEFLLMPKHGQGINASLSAFKNSEIELITWLNQNIQVANQVFAIFAFRAACNVKDFSFNNILIVKTEDTTQLISIDENSPFTSFQNQKISKAKIEFLKTLFENDGKQLMESWKTTITLEKINQVFHRLDYPLSFAKLLFESIQQLTTTLQTHFEKQAKKRKITHSSIQQQHKKQKTV